MKIISAFCVCMLLALDLQAQQPPSFQTFGGRGGRNGFFGGSRFNRDSSSRFSGNQPGANATQPSSSPTASVGIASPSAEAYASAAAGEEQESDLNFVGADLGMVFKVYSVLVNKTILRDPAVTDKTITLKSEKGQKLTKEEQIEAIEMVLEMNDVHLEPYGEKFIRAVPRSTASKDAPSMVDPDGLGKTGKVVSMVIRLNFISYEEAMKILQEVASSKAKLQGIERNNSVLVTDTELNIRRMLEIVKRIDVESKPTEEVKIYQIKNASAADIQQVLQKIVEESQKELDKNGKGVNNAANNNNMQPWMRGGFGRMRSTLRQPNTPQPAPAQSTASILSNISDADRGLIRGKVVILSDERSNKLIIITSASNHKFFKTVIEELDVETTPETEVKVYRLKYAEAEEVSDMINDLIGNAPTSKNSSKQNQNQNAKSGRSVSLTSGAASRTTSANKRTTEPGTGELSKDNTTVLADKRINGLVVMTRKELLPVVERIIESMDIKLSQVLIETVIVEVSLGDDLKTGIDWVLRGKQTGEDGKTIRDNFVNNGNSGLGGGGGTGSAALESMVQIASNAMQNAYFGGATPIGSGVNYLLKSDKLNLAAVIQASKSDSRAKYLASPIVMTVDNKEATINATKMNYLLKGFTSSGNSYSTIAVPDYEQKELGIEIKVTPKINPNGTVMLNVEEKYSQLGNSQEIKYATGNSQQGGSGVLQSVAVPTTVTREMTADVLLENMQTVVFGGLTETVYSESEAGIPILKDIPWVGKWLFGSVQKSESRNELLVFMTPYVLDDAEAAQIEAIRRKKTLSDAKPWDDNGWSASDLSDGVSKKEQMRRLKDEWAKQDEERKAKLAIEQMKVKRAQELKELSKEEREVWLKMHKEELEEEKQEELEKKMLDDGSQEELKALVEQIKAKQLKEAQKEIDSPEKAAKEDDSSKKASK